MKTAARWMILATLMTAPRLGAEEPDWAGFDRYVAAAAKEWSVPGLAIAVVKDDKTVFERGYGTTSLSGGVAVDEHTLFSIGSTTKAMTAAAIGMLVDEGELAWDDPVSEHMPHFRLADPEATARLRVRDLLTHNAGVPNTDVLWYEQPNDLDEILERMRYVELEAAMYSNFTYQNVMYAAAGKLIELVSGMSWGQFIERRIFEPLGMTRSVTSLARTKLRDNVATPHDYVDDQLVTIDNASVDSVAAAGAVWSSVHEMALWARFLLRDCVTEKGERLLAEATCAELFEPQTLVNREMYPAMRLYDHHWFTYGLGWFQTDYNGRALDFHSGSIDGLVALHGLIRGEELGVYILANRDHAEVRHALMYQALDLFDEDLQGENRRDWNREVKELFDRLDLERQEQIATARKAEKADPRPALDRAAYVGTYSDRLFGEVAVTETPGGLRFRFGHQACTLEHAGGNSFRCAWEARWRGQADIQFVPSSPGSIGALRYGGTEFRRAQ